MLQMLGRLPFALFVLGGLVWGLIGIDGFNLVEYFFAHNWVVHAVYILFGAAAVIEFIKAMKGKKFRIK